jgi:hypothetical protein
MGTRFLGKVLNAYKPMTLSQAHDYSVGAHGDGMRGDAAESGISVHG